MYTKEQVITQKRNPEFRFLERIAREDTKKEARTSRIIAAHRMPDAYLDVAFDLYGPGE